MITNSQIGNIVVFVLPKPKFLKAPLLLNKKFGLTLIKIIIKIKNKTIAALILFFLINDLYIIYYNDLFFYK